MMTGNVSPVAMFSLLFKNFTGAGSCRCGVKGSQRIVGGEEADVSC